MSVARAAAGRGRFWGVVSAFFLLNLLAWVGYHHYLSSRLTVLQVEKAFPQDNAIVDPKSTLTWKFNFDVIPTAADVSLGAINPKIDGTWKWKDARTLTFVPSKALPKAAEISVTLQPEHFKSPQGFALAKSFSTRFRTTPLTLVNVQQVGFGENGRVILGLEFDDAVAPEQVLKSLMLFQNKQEVKASLYGSPEGKIVRVITDSLSSVVPAQQLTLHLQPGLAGASGPLAMEAPVDQTIELTRSLMATRLTAYPAREASTNLVLGFNGPVDPSVLRAQLKISPDVKYTIQNEYDGVELVGDFAPATRYTVTLAPPPAGADPTKYPKADTLSVFVPDRSPSVWFEHDEGYLGSKGNRTLLAHAVNVPNVKVEVFRVYDNNLVNWRTAREGSDSRSLDEYAKPIATKTIKLSNERNKKQDIRVSLDDIVPDGARDGVYQLQLSREGETDDEDREYRYYRRENTNAVVTLSDIGIVAKTTHDGACVWAVSLADARPLENIRVRMFSSKNQPIGEAYTNADGIARLTHARLPEGETPAVVLADRLNGSTTTHLTWLDLSTSEITFPESAIGGETYLREGYETFLYTDRGVYRPGETVYLRGIVRGVKGGTPTAFPVKFQMLRPDLRNWKSQVVKLDDSGNCEWIIKLPDDLPTGKWSANLSLPGDKADSFGKVSFQVEEFIPDRMKVALTLPQEMEGRLTAGETTILAKVQADYLFGQPASELFSTLVARLEPARFSPKQFGGWAFGDDAKVAADLNLGRFTAKRLELEQQVTNAKGTTEFGIDFNDLLHAKTKESDADSPAEAMYRGPWRLIVSSSVAENGGRAITAVQSAEVDAVSRYVGIEPVDGLIRAGATRAIQIATVKPDGTLDTQPADLEYQLYRETWTSNLVQRDGRYRYESKRELNPIGSTQTLRTTDGKGEVGLSIDDGGEYVLVVKDKETSVYTSTRLLVGSGEWADSISRENPERLEIQVFPLSLRDTVETLATPASSTRLGSLIMSAASHLPASSELHSGGGALAVVRAPFAGQLLLSVETDDVIRTQVVQMTKPSMVIPIPLDDSMRPNAYVSATVVRSIDANAKWRVHRAVGVAKVDLTNEDHRLNVEFSAPSVLRPLNSLTALVRVTDPSGNPVPNASLTVAAVDEGICSLTKFKTPDPFDFFFVSRALGVDTADVYSELMPEVQKPDRVSAVGGDGADDSYDPRHQTPVSAKRVRPVSLVSQLLRTDTDGIAKFDASVPAFSGQLRLMASVHAKDRFGAGESKVFIRSPLMVQTSWPRFASPGDTFSVTFTVFNHSNESGPVQVSLQGEKDSPLEFGDAKANTLEIGPIYVKAHGQATGTIPIRVRDIAGIAHVRLTAAMNSESFEESIELPIRPAAPMVSTGSYSTITPGSARPIKLPQDFLQGTVKYQLQVNSFPSLRLPEGLEYLDRYPYGCAEQTTSTLFPLVYLEDIGEKVAPGVFSKERTADKINTGITRLLGMQTHDGGVAMWPGLQESWPWVSVYAAHFVVSVERAGYKVPGDFRDRLFAYLRDQLHRSSDAPEVLETQAYACYVLALSGEPQLATMNRLKELLNNTKDASAQAKFHLAAAWLASGRRDLAEKLLPADLPQPRKDRSLAGNIGSAIRDRAIILDTLLSVDPNRAEIPSLAQQLADAGNNNGWRSTQDAAFAVMAIGKYLRTVKESAPIESAELVSGGQTLMSGKSLNYEGAAADNDLQLLVKGSSDAKGFVTLLVSGVPKAPPAAADSGIKIRRRYLDRNGKPLQAAIRSGELVQVELSIESSTAIENLVVEDLLPAGLEIENPRLEGSAKTEDGKRDPKQPATFNPDRRDIRDDRLVLFGDLPQSGRATYTYLARAVTPGEYIVPPARIECMYDLGINSISETGKLAVTPMHAPAIVDTGHD